MGIISVVRYKPKPGKDYELRKIIKGRLPLLRSLKLSTKRMPVHMIAGDGSIIEVSEWVSEKAIEKAHGLPRVLAMWERFDAVCTYETLGSLKESAEMFASFKAIKL